MTRKVAALKRACEQDLAVHTGQDIEYVVVDDEEPSRERVALAHEEIESYDPSYYETELVRDVESLLSSLAWRSIDDTSGTHESLGIGVDGVRGHKSKLTNTGAVWRDLLVNHKIHEAEPPHPVCDMKSERHREGVQRKEASKSR